MIRTAPIRLEGIAGYRAARSSATVVRILAPLNADVSPGAKLQMTDEPATAATTLLAILGSVFPQSRPLTRTTMAMAASVRTYRPGEAILNQGDESSLALVLDGHAALRRTTPDGRQLIVRIVGRGGLASVLPLAARPAAADAVALTQTPVAMWRG